MIDARSTSLNTEGTKGAPCRRCKSQSTAIDGSKGRRRNVNSSSLEGARPKVRHR